MKLNALPIKKPFHADALPQQTGSEMLSTHSVAVSEYFQPMTESKSAAVKASPLALALRQLRD